MKRVRAFTSALILMVTDAAALLASFLLAFFLRSRLLLSLVPRFREIEPLPLETQLRLGFAYGAVIIILVMLYERLYTRRLSFWDEARSLLKGVSIAFIFILVLVFVSRQYIFFSRATIALAWLLSLAIFPVFRLLVKKFLFLFGLWNKKVIILGTNETSKMLAEGIRSHRSLGYEIAGFLAEDEKSAGGVFAGSPIIGTVDRAEPVIQQMDVRDFIVVLPSFSQDQLVRVMEKFDEYADTIRMVPNIGSLFTLGIKAENLGDILALNLNRNLFKPWNLVLKHVFEYLIILVLLVLLLPIFAAIALLIKLDTKGPVFFVQDRIGKKGKTFRIIKFRSMYADADKKLDAFLKENPSVKKEWDKYQKIKGYDPRVTKVGKFLRRYSLDELPQILNVIKGEMSLVGPRPYLPREKKILAESSRFISRIRPGITGLWQVRGRNLLSFKKRILLDEYYIRNWSLWLDIIILFKTPEVLARREGAF